MGEKEFCDALFLSIVVGYNDGYLGRLLVFIGVIVVLSRGIGAGTPSEEAEAESPSEVGGFEIVDVEVGKGLIGGVESR